MSSSEEPVVKGHPPHLKGKAIGLFYAKQNRKKRKKALQDRRAAKALGKGPQDDSNANDELCASSSTSNVYMSSSEDEYSPSNKNAKKLIDIDKHLNKLFGEVILSETEIKKISDLLNNTSELSGSINFDSAFHKKLTDVISGSLQNSVPPSDVLLSLPEVDELFLRQYLIRQGTPAYKYMLEKRQKLPAYKMRDQILKIINDNSITLVSGETGCGKTTQVAQFILNDYIENTNGSRCKIICTQPRRISAIAMAERVAAERAESLGTCVGYQIRLENKLPRNKGSILFCTTGVILRQMASDPYLSEISHIIVDEIHERSIESDFLLSILKYVLTKRQNLKLVLMSATLNCEMFSAYFDNCAHINIPGFTHPVKEYYLEDVLTITQFRLDMFQNRKRGGKWKRENNDTYFNIIDPYVRQLESENKYSRQVCIQLRQPEIEEVNLDLILELLVNICIVQQTEGAILIFATGYSMISSLHKMITNSARFPHHRYLVIPLHSQMPTVHQREVFERPPPGVRKIIISTQIAETSITIDDVVFVIDCGKLKLSNFDTNTNTETLGCEWVSLANAQQRRGRAGRVRPGVCYHLYSRARELLLSKYQEPEILRTRLENTILDIKILKLGKAETFLGSLIDSPSPEAIAAALKFLKRLNALNEDETLTPLGFHLAKLPMQVQVAKMLLMGAIFGCLNPILSIAASLDFRDPFQSPLGKEKEALQKKRELANNCKSDHIVLHYALMKFEQLDIRSGKEFCYNYYLNWHTLKQLKKMKSQLMEFLYKMKFVNSNNPNDNKCNVNSGNLSLIKAIICAGLYPNIGVIRYTRHKNIVYTLDKEKCELVQKSLVFEKIKKRSLELITYYAKLRSTSNWIYDATLMHPLPILFFGDKFEHNDSSGKSIISVGVERLKFKCSSDVSKIIQDLKDRLNWILESKITNPGIVDWTVNSSETSILRAIVELITHEDLTIYLDTDSN